MTIFSKSRAKRTGSTMVWLAVCLIALMGILALGLDGGRMMEERRRAQAAADAAALAGAKAGYDQLHLAPLRIPSTTPLVQAATASLNNAGYVNDGLWTTLSVNVGPSSGLFPGNTSYVEVIVEN